MMLRQFLGGMMLLAFAGGCGPRLRHADAPKATTAIEEAPVAKIAVQYDASKLDANHKYSDSGQFTVNGLFFESGQPKPATVKVTRYEADGKVSRGYTIDLGEILGASAKVEMWDDGFLSLTIPKTPDQAPLFQTSNTNIKAVTVEVPGAPGQTRVCYYGKDILEGQIRFALCDLQTAKPVLAFVDAEPEAPAAAPAPAPAAATP
jgi:hypothetical protein